MNRHILLRWAGVLIGVTLILSACDFTQVAPMLKPTDTSRPMPVASPKLADTPRPTETAPTRRPTDAPRATSAPTLAPTPTAFAPSSDAYKGWLQYVSAAYGFSLRYPRTGRSNKSRVNTR